MMDAEIKQKWIEALRSGKYKQTTCWLRRDTKFCCLGVFADVATPTEWSLPSNGTLLWEVGGDNALQYPEYWDRFGVTYSIAEKLSELNDNGKSFSEIADYIEREL